MNTIITKNLSKKIKSNVILDNINMSLSGGTVYGLKGKNGSGKTMLIRTLSGLIKPSEGSIFFNEKELFKDMDFMPNLGIIIENICLYPDFTGFHNLKILADINKKITDSDIRTTIENVGLDPDDKRTVKKYSLGMKQRLAIAQAIMEKPDVLFLDEPTNALDDSGIEMLIKICNDEASRGAIVLVCSHDSDFLNELCRIIYKIDNGAVSLIHEESGSI